MWKFNAVPLVLAAAVLSACAQQQPVHPVARPYPTQQFPYPAQQFPYPAQRQDPIRDTSQQLSSVQQIMQQIQSLKSTIGRF